MIDRLINWLIDREVKRLGVDLEAIDRQVQEELGGTE